MWDVNTLAAHTPLGGMINPPVIAINGIHRRLIT
jgi:hypothetical protein